MMKTLKFLHKCFKINVIKIFKNKWEDEKNDQKLKSIKNFKLKKNY